MKSLIEVAPQSWTKGRWSVVAIHDKPGPDSHIVELRVDTRVGEADKRTVIVRMPGVNEEELANAYLIAVAPKLMETLRDAIGVIEDFMPNIGRCTLQDYGRLNRVLLESKPLLEM